MVASVSTAIAVRLATVTDLPEILRLYQQPDLDDGQSLSLTEATAFFEKTQRYPSYHLYVAVLGDRIVGTFALLIMDNLLHLGAASAIVEAVAVDPEYHSQGIGRRMMHQAMAVAQQAQCYKLVLSSNQTRQRAHAFYESLGFIWHGYCFAVELDAASE